MKRVEAEVIYQEQALVIVGTYDTSSASFNLGLQPGDRIISIDGKSIPNYFSSPARFYLVKLPYYSTSLYPTEFYTWPFRDGKMALVSLQATNLTVEKPSGEKVIALNKFLPNRTLNILLTVQLAVALFFWATGLVLFFFRPDQLMTLCFDLFFGFTGMYLLASSTGSLYKDPLFFIFLVLCSFICPTSFLLFTLLFPLGNLLRIKVLVTFTVLVLLDFVTSLAFLVLNFIEGDSDALNLAGFWRLSLFSLLTFSGLVVLCIRFVCSKGLERAKIQLAIFSITMAGLLPMLVFVLYSFFGLFTDVVVNYYGVIELPSVVIPVTLLYSILKHRLFYPDLIIKTILSHLLLTIMLVALYLVASIAITAFMYSAFGIGNSEFGMLAMIVVAITASKLLELSRKFVDHLFYRDRLNYTGLIKDWSFRLAHLDNRINKLFGEVTQGLARDFRYERIALLLVEKIGPTFDWNETDIEVNQGDHYRLFFISTASTPSNFCAIDEKGVIDQLVDWADFERQGLTVSTLELERFPEEVFRSGQDLIEGSLPLKGLDLTSYRFFLPFENAGTIPGGLLYGEKLGGQLAGAEEINALLAINRQIALSIHLALRIKREIYKSRLINTLMIKRDSIRDEEHQEFSRELHDTAMQEVDYINYFLNSWRDDLRQNNGRLPEPGTEEKILNSIEQLCKVSLNLQAQMRSLIQQLRPRPDVFGLVVALQELLFSYKERNSEIRYRFYQQLTPDQVELVGHFSEEAKRHIFRIVQEAVTNATRHSKGDRISLHLYMEEVTQGNRLVVEITDNGTGLKAREGAELTDLVLGRHFGLVTMNERAALLNGTLAFKTPRSGGTLVQLTIPIPSLQNPQKMAENMKSGNLPAIASEE